jgi:hypothetical protein
MPPGCAIYLVAVQIFRDMVATFSLPALTDLHLWLFRSVVLSHSAGSANRCSKMQLDYISRLLHRWDGY